MKNKLALWGFILSLVSISFLDSILRFIPGINSITIFSIILIIISIIALVLSIMSLSFAKKNKLKKPGLGIAGIIISGLSIIIRIILLIVIIVFSKMIENAGTLPM